MRKIYILLFSLFSVASMAQDVTVDYIADVEARAGRYITIEGSLTLNDDVDAGSCSLEVSTIDADGAKHVLSTVPFSELGVTLQFKGAFAGFGFDVDPLDTPLRSTLRATVVGSTAATPYAEATLVNRGTTYDRNVVVEEGTGTWCQYCVRGIVGMEYMATTYPDRFIGIGVHNNDSYAVDSYQGLINMMGGGLPCCIMNRTDSFDPSQENLETYYKKVIGTRVDAQVEFCSASYDESTRTVTATAACRWAYTIQNGGDYRLIFVVTEDGIEDYQKNAYAGGAYGAMGGFESKTNPCLTAIPDVARAICPNLLGTKNRLKANDIVYDRPLADTRTFTLPEGTGSADKLTLVALLVDGSTSAVINAAKVKFSDFGSIEDPLTGIDGVSANTGTTATSPQRGAWGAPYWLSPTIYIQNGRKILKH